ncbi:MULTISPECIES: hypothetical protein [unclassified Streptococcus]|uniref:hypothetical protein n=1 Tax=unclassified Streptococcus TaxID=2608887 RepID=UPI00211B6677|nr:MULTISPECIES: hypothetical protein [unclassified Streptococcus]MCQ9211626.1 hypothetical protein [Streptococcus sp. B01]MCQ9213145.1 hypothetical protein [Streptococcus sp. O1]MCQ9214933.1 hypothetical protein [Streptococcus sp. O1]MCQ9215066.1 hypothetical protein [Streptococcus sp. O1]
MRPKRYPYCEHKVKKKNPLQIHDLEIKISHELGYPRLVLNDIDFTKNNIGLQALKIDWETYTEEQQESFVQIDYVTMTNQGNVIKTSLRQSFPNRFR